MDNTVKLVGYARVSRVAGREGESFISPEVQRDRIAKYAELHAHTLVGVLEDLDEPGSKYQRPGFQEALARVENGEAEGMIVAKLDRFARSQHDAVVALRRLEEAGGTLVSVDDALDTSTPMGRFARSMMLAIAELELDRIRETWDVSQAKAVERGVHISSRVPTGYRRKTDRRLEPDPAAAPVITELFRRRAAGEGWTQLARFLDDSGVTGPYANKIWTPSSVQKLIRNNVYLGIARSGRHVNTDAHDPLVTRSEWEAAQSMKGKSAPGNGQLLSGILRCAGCRYKMKADTMKDRDGSRVSIYRCRGRHPGGECHGPASILGRVVEPHVEQAFLDALGPDGPFAEAVLATDALDAAVTDLETAERELVAYRDEPVIIERIGMDSFLAGLEVRAKTVNDAQARVFEARRQASLPSVALTPGDLRAAWPTLPLTEKRTILAAAIDTVFLRRARGASRQVPVEDRSLILWHGQGPTDLPRRGKRVPLEPFTWPS